MKEIQPGDIVKALFHFNAEDPKELSVHENDKLMVQEIIDQWVFVTCLDRQGSGFVPKGYLDLYHPENGL